MGYLHLRKARTAGAVRLFELQAEVFPDDASAYDSLGEAYLAAGRPVEAMAAYRRATFIEPDVAHAAEVLDHLAGLLRLQTGRLP